jgi:transposase
VIEWKRGDEYRFVSRYTVVPSVCPKCGVDKPRLYVHAWKDQPFRDISMHGKPTFVVVQRPRYKCRECGETFQQPLPDMDERRFMTKRLLEWIGQRSLRKTFAEIAADVGVDEKTVRLVFNDHVRTLDTNHVFRTPKWLGIDELMLVRKIRCIMTNVHENAIYDLLEDRNYQLVVNRLMAMKQRDQIELVAMDMWKPYRDAVKATLPAAALMMP